MRKLLNWVAYVSTNYKWRAFLASGGVLVFLWALRWMIMGNIPNWMLHPLAILSAAAFIFNVFLIVALTWQEFEKRGRWVEIGAGLLFLAVIFGSAYAPDWVGGFQSIFGYLFSLSALVLIVCLIGRVVAKARKKEAWRGYMNIHYALWPFTLMFFLGAFPLSIAEIQWRIGMTARVVMVDVNAPTGLNRNYDPLGGPMQSRYEFGASRVKTGADGEPVVTNRGIDLGIIDSPELFDWYSGSRSTCVNNGAGITGKSEGLMTLVITGIRLGAPDIGWRPNTEFIYYGLGRDGDNLCTYPGQGGTLRWFLGKVLAF